MAESYFLATEGGSGKKLRTFNRTIGANSVEEEGVFLAEQNMASYVVTTGGISIATAAAHVIQVMGDAAVNLYVRRITVHLDQVVTAAQYGRFQLLRLTSAGTGGTTANVTALDAADASAGSAMTLPTSKGTEGVALWQGTHWLMQTPPAAGSSMLMFDIDFDRLRMKSLRIPAGIANGICLKNTVANAGGTILVNVQLSAASF